MSTPIFLNALRAFEAAARHRSFAGAALELNVTPAAVGQLVRGLEDWLGAPLFHRAPGGRVRLLPTQIAESALGDVRAGLDRLHRGLERMKEGALLSVLTVTVSPAFAAKWLLPRIERFQAAWPDMDVRLDTSHSAIDLAARGVDIGVRYGQGRWPGLTAQKLMDEEIYPVCSPALQRRMKFRRPADLAGQTLIHDLSIDPGTGFASWEAWVKQAGVPELNTGRGMRINNSAAVLQAAIDGQGIALARSVMACDDVVSGRLVRLFPDVRCPSALAYYVVHQAGSVARPGVRAFRDWLVDEARFECPA